MTIIGVGKPVPSQLFLMHLAGLVITGRRKNLNPTDEEITQSREMGYRMLRRLTGEDFGYDVERWYNFLIAGDYALTHPYGFGALRRFLQNAGYNFPFKNDESANSEGDHAADDDSSN